MNRKARYDYREREFSLQLNSFESWLKARGYAKDSIRPLRNYAGCFLAWLAERELDVCGAGYSDLLDFVARCRQEDGTGLTNRKLGAIRHYYRYLQHEGFTGKNPAAGLYLKGTRRRIPRDLLEREALDELYEHYQACGLREQRNKVMLGLVLYQGLSMEELHKLTVEDIDLKTGRIAIGGGSRTSGRVLSLQSCQIMELHEYLHATRPAILRQIAAYDGKSPYYRPGRMPYRIDTARLNRQLFMSMNGSSALKNSMKHLMRALQEINPLVKSAAQLRQSVIAHWLKTRDVRQVQYMAGHRHVSSTERYREARLEDLGEALQRHHPLEQE